MRNFKSMWTSSESTNKEDYTNSVSKTQPGMALSPQQILERFTSGRPMAHIPGYYEFSGDRTCLIKSLPDISRYDFFDQKEYYETLETELTKLKNQLLKGSTKSLENTLKDKIAEIQDKIDHPENYDNNPDNDTVETP